MQAATLLSSGTRPARFTSQAARRRGVVVVRADKPLREFREDTGEVRRERRRAAQPCTQRCRGMLGHVQPPAASRTGIRGPAMHCTAEAHACIPRAASDSAVHVQVTSSGGGSDAPKGDEKPPKFLYADEQPVRCVLRGGRRL